MWWPKPRDSSTLYSQHPPKQETMKYHQPNCHVGGNENHIFKI